MYFIICLTVGFVQQGWNQVPLEDLNYFPIWYSFSVLKENKYFMEEKS